MQADEGDVLSSQMASIWSDFAAKNEYSRDRFDRASLFDLFSIPVAEETPLDPLAPIYVCISRAMRAYTAKSIEKYTRGGYGLCDCSWKYRCAGLQILAIGIGADHYDCQAMDTLNMGLMMGLAAVPKENEQCAIAAWQSLLNRILANKQIV